MKKMIGVVGGVGSYAGIDLIRKIYDQTNNTLSDQDHLPVSMLSTPDKVVDRTEFLLGNISVNPGEAISNIISILHNNGASLIGIPCNTAHADSIFKKISKNKPRGIKIIHMIEEVVKKIITDMPNIKKVGVLSTIGTLITNIYPQYFSKYNISTIQMTKELQELYVQPAIYNKQYGIKVFSNPISEKAKEDLIFSINYLIKKGAESIVLGCTEIPLAIHDHIIDNVPIIDATHVLASALVRESSPKQSKQTKKIEKRHKKHHVEYD